MKYNENMKMIENEVYSYLKVVNIEYIDIDLYPGGGIHFEFLASVNVSR